MSSTDMLRRVGLLRELSADELEGVASAVREEAVSEDTDVVKIGDPGRSLYIVLEGEVSVLYPGRSADVELARLGPGDFFGEMALLNDEPRSATVRTVVDSRLLVLEKEAFRRILTSRPGVAVKVLETLSVRIRNADEQISTLSDKVLRDTLTGLLNRRAFHERLHEEADRYHRYGDEFSLILLDVDHFKSVNDTFGHDVGDHVLGWIGRLLSDQTRSADVPFRVGGEEFAVLAPATGGEIAGEVADRLLRVIGDARPPVEFDLRVTVSGGYASCPRHASRAPRLFTIADQALLRAKTRGRNQVFHPGGEG